MAMLDALIKERNDALFSLDRTKIEAFCAKHGDADIADLSDQEFWEGVYKAICVIENAPDEKVHVAKTWLASHCSSKSMGQ